MALQVFSFIYASRGESTETCNHSSSLLYQAPGCVIDAIFHDRALDNVFDDFSGSIQRYGEPLLRVIVFPVLARERYGQALRM